MRKPQQASVHFLSALVHCWWPQDSRHLLRPRRLLADILAALRLTASAGVHKLEAMPPRSFHSARLAPACNPYLLPIPLDALHVRSAVHWFLPDALQPMGFHILRAGRLDQVINIECV